MDLNKSLTLLVALALPFLGGFFGAKNGPDEWYTKLKRPSWNPPNWAFPVVWTMLYLSMGIASFLVYSAGGFEAHKPALTMYLVQLLLNFAWTPLFFGAHRMDLAFLDISLMWAAIASTIYLFYQVNHVAAYLLVPYIAWVSLAAALNLNLWQNNPELNGVKTSDLAPLQSSR